MVQGRDLNRIVTLIIAAGTAGFGYDQAVMSSIIEMHTFKEFFNDPSEMMIGIMICLFEVGAGFGALLCGRIADKLGRRKTLAIGCATVCLGTGLQAGATSMALMNVGRVVAGLGIGAMMTTLPLLQSEVAPSHHRGKSQAIHWTISVVGFSAALWIDIAFMDVAKAWNWRAPIALQAILVIAVAAGLCIVPESPRWLAGTGKMDAAKRVVYRITEARDENDKRIKDKEVERQLRNRKAEDEIVKLQTSIEQETKAGRTHLREMFKNEDGLNIRKRTFLAMGIQTMQQLTGINAFVYYQVTIFIHSGCSYRTALFLAGFNALSYLVSTLIPVFVIEKYGRRPLLIFGAIGQAAAMALVGVMTILSKPYTDRGDAIPSMYAYPAAAGVVIFVFIFGIAWLCIPWFLPAELFPQRQRSMGCALATLANFVFNALIGALVPTLLKELGGWLFIGFCALNILFAAIVYTVYPETSGLSLEDLDKLFDEQPKIKKHEQMSEFVSGMEVGASQYPPQ